MRGFYREEVMNSLPRRTHLTRTSSCHSLKEVKMNWLLISILEFILESLKEKELPTTKEAMNALPKERSAFYRSLVGTEVTSIDIDPGLATDKIGVKIVFTRKCKDGSIAHILNTTAREGQIDWPVVAKGENE